MGMRLYLTQQEAEDLSAFLSGAWDAAPDEMPEDASVSRVMKKLHVAIQKAQRATARRAS